MHRVIENIADAFRERSGVARRHEVARHAIRHRERQAAHIGGDDGRATRHCLERDHAKRFVMRRHHNDIRRRIVERQHVLPLRAEKRHQLIQPQFIAQAQQARHLGRHVVVIFRAAADDA